MRSLRHTTLQVRPLAFRNEVYSAKRSGTAAWGSMTKDPPFGVTSESMHRIGGVSRAVTIQTGDTVSIPSPQRITAGAYETGDKTRRDLIPCATFAGESLGMH